MDLTPDQISELISRAQQEWENIKESTDNMSLMPKEIRSLLLAGAEPILHTGLGSMAMEILSIEFRITEADGATESTNFTLSHYSLSDLRRIWEMTGQIRSELLKETPSAPIKHIFQELHQLRDGAPIVTRIIVV